WS
ncbi:hypothetical protein EC990672_3509B, partial [Escherichia coli 99.0672]